MKKMEEKILSEGTVLPGEILKVGSFLNQRIDVEFLGEIGKEIASLYEDCGVTKILTVEASGIAIAVAAALEMGVPMVFAKKHRSSNVDGEVYSEKVHSYTHNHDYNMVVSRDYLKKEDVVLIVDDFLANGAALSGLCGLCSQAGSEVAGAAVAIEKKFQRGGDSLREKGIRIESLAMIDEMTDTELTFFRGE